MNTSIYILNSNNINSEKQLICYFCKIALVKKQNEVMLENPKTKMKRQFSVLCNDCPNCGRIFISESQRNEIKKNNPGYDVVMNLDIKVDTLPQQKTEFEKPPIIAPIMFTNSRKAKQNICPMCSSVTSENMLNIPLYNEKGKFYRYYARSIPFCQKCQMGIIDEETATAILRKTRTQVEDIGMIKFKNGSFKIEQSQKYLFYPSAKNSPLIYSGKKESDDTLGTFNPDKLKDKSFLQEMGYSFDKENKTRKAILDSAVKNYSLRKVADHLAFLISSRKNQEGGEIKYAKAIAVWQEDLDYITNK